MKLAIAAGVSWLRVLTPDAVMPRKKSTMRSACGVCSRIVLGVGNRAASCASR
jgi:hypothetical protein